MVRVLLIDDEEVTRLLLLEYFRSCGWAAEVVRIGSPDFAAGAAANGAWGIIFVDFLYGVREEGPRVLRSIRSHVGAGVPLVMLTQLDLASDLREQCANAGADAVVRKWPSRLEMDLMLRRWLGQPDSGGARSAT